MIIAHGTLMGICFGCFFPFGGIFVRVLSKSPVRIHYTIQLLGLAMVLVACGLGVNLSKGAQLCTLRTPLSSSC